VRGSVLASRFEFVADRWGEEGRRTLLANLSQSELKRLAGVARDGDWFDFETLERLDRAIVEDLARGASGIAHELGWASAEYNLAFLRRALPPGLDTRRALERIARGTLLQSFGCESCEPIDGGLALTVRYPLGVPAVYRATVAGFYAALLVAFGCEDARVVERVLPYESLGIHRYDLLWSDRPAAPARVVPEVGGAEPEVFRRSGAESVGRRPLAIEAAPRAAALASPRTPRRVGPGPLGRAKRPALSRGTLGLFALVLVLALVACVRWLAYFTGPEPDSSVDRIRVYEREGGLDLDLLVDTPFVRLHAPSPVSAATITIHDHGKAFSLVLPTIAADTFLEAEIASFKAPDGSSPDPSRAPVLVTARGHQNEERVASEYRLVARSR
jgi:hypothetical protein